MNEYKISAKRIKALTWFQSVFIMKIVYLVCILLNSVSTAWTGFWY